MSKYYKADDVEREIERLLRFRGRNDFDFGAKHGIETVERVLKDLPTIEVSEDCISRGWLLKNYITVICDNVKCGECPFGVDDECKVEDFIRDAPSVVPTTENEIKLCRNCENAYIYQDCMYCDEIEEETEIEPNDACSLWKLRENAPSVVPSRAEVELGMWLDSLGKEVKGNFSGYCSVCGNWSEYLTDYCGNCGAEMESEE